MIGKLIGGVVIIIALLIFGELVIAGTQSGQQGFQQGVGAPTPTTPSVAPTTSSADPVTDQAYLSALRSGGVPFTSDESAITAGHAVCSFLDAGGTVISAADIAASQGNLSTTHAGYLVGAAMAAYCPARS